MRAGCCVDLIIADEQNASYSMAFYRLTGRRYDICRGTAFSVVGTSLLNLPVFVFFKVNKAFWLKLKGKITYMFTNVFEKAVCITKTVKLQYSIMIKHTIVFKGPVCKI